jgi:hypothetical protein
MDVDARELPRATILLLLLAAIAAGILLGVALFESVTD